MKRTFKLLSISFLSLSLFTACSTSEQPQQETFTYQVTSINNNEYYGQSTTDNTGVFFTSSDLQADQIIQVNDIINVTFESFDEITSITEVN